MPSSWTKKNHYVPAGLIHEFAEMPAQDTRESVVLCEWKGGGRRPMTAETVFFEKHAYSLPTMPDRRAAGMMVYVWSNTVPRRLDASTTPWVPAVRESSFHADIGALADEFGPDGRVRPDALEKILAHELDGPFIELARQVRAGRDAREPAIDWRLRNYLTVACYRSPAWLDSPLSKRMIHDGLIKARAEIERSGNVSKEAWEDPLSGVQEEVLSLISNQMYMAICVRERHVMFPPHRFAVELLVAKEGMGFILADNICRPYSSFEDPRALSFSPKGLQDPGVVITYPIGPRHCLRLVHRPSGPRFQARQVRNVEVRRINTALVTLAERTVVYPKGKTDVFLDGVTVKASPPWAGA